MRLSRMAVNSIEYALPGHINIESLIGMGKTDVLRRSLL